MLIIINVVIIIIIIVIFFSNRYPFIGLMSLTVTLQPNCVCSKSKQINRLEPLIIMFGYSM